MVEAYLRPLTDAERRLLRAKSQDLRRIGHRRKRSVVAVGAPVIGVLWALTLAASDVPWPIVTGFWVVAGTGILLWVQYDLSRDVKAFDRTRQTIESAIRAGKARVLEVRANAFAVLEEIEDEGACYVFEVAEDRLLFLTGQQYYESARFPSLEFSLVHALDERGRVVDAWIQKMGPKAAPVRIVPAATKSKMDIPDDLDTIDGTLDNLEELLDARSKASG